MKVYTLIGEQFSGGMGRLNKIIARIMIGILMIPMHPCTVEPPINGHIGTSHLCPL